MGRLEQTCRERGVKLTQPRRAVLEVLETSRDHPSVGEIHRRVRQRHRIALATTYRVLNRLTEAGVLTRHLFVDKAHYELAGRRHHHLIDRSTGRIVEIDDPALTALLEQALNRLGYRLVDYHLELTGEVERSG
ncbi:MAG: transcriptional repressor [Proteobacteria bacterium]|nr:transcriptional repressor [Pseudomonadota bacterium]